MKHLKLFLILVVMLMVTGICFADGGSLYRNGPDDDLQSEVFVSTAAGSLKTPSTIGTQHRLLGYSFISTTAGVVGVYDATTANAVAGTGLIFEDSTIANDCHTVWFPFPKKIVTSIRVIFSAADGKLTLFYE